MGYGSFAWKFEATPSGMLRTARALSFADPGVRSSRRCCSSFAISAARVLSPSVTIPPPGIPTTVAEHCCAYNRVAPCAASEGRAALGPEVHELEGDPEIVALEQLDGLLEVVLLLAGDPDLVP